MVRIYSGYTSKEMQWVVRSSVLVFWYIKYWKMYTYSEHVYIKFEATTLQNETDLN